MIILPRDNADWKNLIAVATKRGIQVRVVFLGRIGKKVRGIHIKSHDAIFINIETPNKYMPNVLANLLSETECNVANFK